MMLFTHLSLLVFSIGLLLAIAYIAVRKSTLVDTRRDWFKWHLLASFVFILCTFLSQVLYEPGYRLQWDTFYLLQYPTVLFAAITYGELCYSVAGLTGTPQLQRYRLVVLIAATAWGAGYAYALQTGVGFTLLLLLPIALFSWPAVPLGLRLRGASVSLFKPQVLWYKEAPVEDTEKAMLGFFYATAMRIIISTAPLLTNRQHFPAELIYGAFFVAALLIVAAMVVAYLAFIEKRANLADKIISFLGVFLVLTLVTVILTFYRDNQEMSARDAVFMQHNSILLTPNGDGYMAVAADPVETKSQFTRLAGNGTGVHRIPLPFDFSVFGDSYREMLVYENGQIVPVLRDAKGPGAAIRYQVYCLRNASVIYVFCMPGADFDVFTAMDDTALIVRWRLKSSEAGTRENVMEARLSADGKILFTYNDFPKSWSMQRENLIGLHRLGDATAPAFEFSDMPLAVGAGGFQFDIALGRRQQIHTQLWPVVVLVLAVFAVVMLVFKPFLVALVVKPLAYINDGLLKVDGGQLDHRLKTSSKDEFSDLAGGFNNMLKSLEKARQRRDEQSDLLESEIAFRTVEAAKNIDPTILSKDQVFESKLWQAIIDNISDFDFQVNELAEAMAVSPRQLHRRAVDTTAQTPASLIRTIRLDHAHKLLSANATNVSEAAYKSGFRDVSYFGKLFHKKYAAAPSSLLIRK